MSNTYLVSVSSETSRLRRALVHSPDSGLAKVIPSKDQDWLFEDIVHLNTIRREEYDYNTKLLLYFLDFDKIQGQLTHIDTTEQNRKFYKSTSNAFYRSENVVEPQVLLAEILQDNSIKKQLIASVCAIESCTYDLQQEMLAYDSAELSRLFFTGLLQNELMIFAPIPNFIFTRDIGAVINDYILLNRPMKEARKREAMLAKYIFFHHRFFADYKDHILELKEPSLHFLQSSDNGQPAVTLERARGGFHCMSMPLKRD